MNDKQQLAAMGAQYRLTEEQAKALAERMPQTGVLQILDDEPLCTEIRINGEEACGADIGGLLDRCLPHTTEQKPLCMAKRIEELEAQLAEKSIKVERLREMNLIAMKRVDGMLDRDLELSRLQSLISEGWQLVPVKPTDHMTWVGQSMRYDSEISIGSIYCAMIAAATKPEAK